MFKVHNKTVAVIVAISFKITGVACDGGYIESAVIEYMNISIDKGFEVAEERRRAHEECAAHHARIEWDKWKACQYPKQ